MKKTETLFFGTCLLGAVVVTGALLWHFVPTTVQPTVIEYPANKYGAFLAAQHAIYINDFETAAKLSKQVTDTDLPIVRNTIMLTDFLNGRLPDNAAKMGSDASAPAQLIYDAYLLQNDDWESIYKRHKKDSSALAAPLRIWSGVATGRVTETLKFIDTLPTNSSWKSFVRGQIYAETGKTANAAEQFSRVSLEFININDYLYMLAFYNAYGMQDAADKLCADFTATPGGMYMLDGKISPKWDEYSGYKNALAFGLVQSVSHTQVMMYSDLSLVMLRFAEIVGGGSDGQSGAINYYLGQYFFNNGGDYKKFFDAIDKNGPFYLFSSMKVAEKTGDIKDLERISKQNPLFIPAIKKLVAKNIQTGDKGRALSVINRALANKNLTDGGRAFFLKTRANTHLVFGDLDDAQDDIKAAADILPLDAGIIATQSRIWSGQRRELDNAYEYAIALVHKNPSDIESWDTLGMAVAAKEGPKTALDMLERVGAVSQTCSSLFEHLGDLYVTVGNIALARDSYTRAINLSDDGLSVVPILEQKIKDLK